MKDKKLLKAWLINSSIGISAVRNQGNGIAKPIREKLMKEFDLDEFFKRLKVKRDDPFQSYLDRLTDQLAGLKGESNNNKPAGKVKWGTARKCINLLLRSAVYNGMAWHHYGLTYADFACNGLIRRLELPLDSHVIKGIKKDCGLLGIEFNSAAFSSFSIIKLDKKEESPYYQTKALEIASEKGICRIDLDLHYWRNQEN